MNIFELTDGRRSFTQWDTGRQLIVHDTTCTEVHFCNGTSDCSLVCKVKEQGDLRVVNVPDILLQYTRSITVFAFVEDANGGYTRRAVVFSVRPRTKPSDYVYTDDERLTWDSLDQRIRKLEENPGGVDLTGYVKTVNGKAPDARGNVQIETGGGGLNATASGLLIEILRNGVYSTDQSENITALATALSVTEPDEPEPPVEPDEPDVPEVTLSSISATYSGGDVAVGTAVADLTGIVVTAHYSDGTSKTVTGYTLSGTIAEGSNTVTVSYGGKTTTFAVNGVAESDEPDTPVDPDVPETKAWSDGYFNTDGNVKAWEGYMYCEEYFPVTPGQKYYLTNSDTTWRGSELLCAVYDADKNFITRLTGTANNQAVTMDGLIVSVTAPENAAFIRVSCDNMTDYKNTAIFVPETELPTHELTIADTTWIEGYVGSDGRIAPEDGCWCSWYITAEPGATYKFGNSVSEWSAGWYGIGFFDITGKFIIRQTSAQFTVPENACYIRLSAQNMTGYCDAATLEKVS